MRAPSLSLQARPLIDLDLATAAFAADWRHCDQIANYLASLTSLGRPDPIQYSNLLSTVLNELFEIAFLHHANAGHLHCSLHRDGPTDRIDLEIPVDKSQRAFYDRAVSDAQSDRVSKLYSNALLGESTPERPIGLLELAADYGARIWLDDSGQGNALHLVVDVCIEDPASNLTTAVK